MITLKNQTGTKLCVTISRNKDPKDFHLWIFTEDSRQEVSDIADTVIDKSLPPDHFIRTNLIDDCELHIHLSPESLRLRDEVYTDGSHVMTAYFVQ